MLNFNTKYEQSFKFTGGTNKNSAINKRFAQPWHHQFLHLIKRENLSCYVKRETTFLQGNSKGGFQNAGFWNARRAVKIK